MKLLSKQLVDLSPLKCVIHFRGQSNLNRVVSIMCTCITNHRCIKISTIGFLIND